MSQLYYIALVPHESLRERVKGLKEELQLNFDVKHALKSPAHITLVMPFRRSVDAEHALVSSLDSFAATQSNFEVVLDGFDCFAPRVLFVKIKDHHPITRLHVSLNHFLSVELNFEEKELKSSFHPHMTIATRDLSEEAFNQAWPLFEKRAFEDTFVVSSIFLIKHNGKHWDIFKEFEFDRKDS